MAKPNDYAAALDELDQMRAAGRVSQAQYDVHRARLLAEASKTRLPMAVRIALFVVIVLVLFVLLRVVLALVGY